MSTTIYGACKIDRCSQSPYDRSAPPGIGSMRDQRGKTKRLDAEIEAQTEPFKLNLYRALTGNSPLFDFDY